MKNLLSFTIVIFLGLAIAPFSTFPGEKQMGAAITHTRDFEKMKELVGVWEGTADMGKGIEMLKVTYELTSAGNAILEKFAVGQPHEMVTVYYDSGGKLTMTHYCSLGNRPHMELMKSGESAMEFVLSEKNHGLSVLNETHMHALKIAFDGKDRITQTWTLYDQGEKKSDVMIKLARAKS
jgi:hypothetical protein